MGVDDKQVALEGTVPQANITWGGAGVRNAIYDKSFPNYPRKVSVHDA